MKKLIAFLAIGFYAIRYRVSPVILWSIAEQESAFNPSVGYHPDNKSYGLMGINVKGGAFNDYQKEHPSLTLEEFEKSVFLNVKISAWYLTQKLPVYHKGVDSLKNLLASYNAGAGNVNKKGHSVTEYDEQVLARIENLKIKVWFMYFGVLIIPVLSTIALSAKGRGFFKRR